MDRRLKQVFLPLLLALTGCAASSGTDVPAIASALAAADYIPLHRATHLGIDSDEGAAMVVAPGMAVTVAHNANLLDAKGVVGTARDYDLLFFRVSRAPRAATAPVRAGMAVTAYGEGAHGGLRQAPGVVRAIQTCAGCTAPAYFTFAGDAGPGFSGGPVLDGQGRLAGITFGYKDTGRERLIYAYDMSRVTTEMRRLSGALAAGEN